MIYYLSLVQSMIIGNIIYGSLLVQILRHHNLAKAQNFKHSSKNVMSDHTNSISKY